jgi:hypothetical protein
MKFFAAQIMRFFQNPEVYRKQKTDLKGEHPERPLAGGKLYIFSVELTICTIMCTKLHEPDLTSLFPTQNTFLEA